jgi:adenosine deaminase
MVCCGLFNIDQVAMMKKFILTLLLGNILCFSAKADVNQYFNSIKQEPNALYAFLKAMPKGGELHYHLAGGAYTEAMLNLAASKPYCLNTKTHSVSVDKGCVGKSSAQLADNEDLYEAYLKAWSFKDFDEDDAESADEHFFASFYKFIPIVSAHEAEMLVDVLQRADSQQEQYMEIMTIPDDAKSLSFASLIKNKKTDAEKLATLQKNKAFNKNVTATINNGHAILEKTHGLLGCDKDAKAAGCGVEVKFQYYVLREVPNEDFFAMAVNAFEVANRSPDFVAVNVVQEEDSPMALKNYKRQMQIIGFLHQHYPNVHISLHAGELAERDVAPDDLRFHIHDAIMVAHAERIGHGDDIAFEDNAEQLLSYMANNNIAVEINLTSNQWLLRLRGANSPLHYYLAHSVPVVLSTDDEGILRTNLTNEYRKAVLEQGLDYQQLKTLTRNVLTYGFLSGQSLWQDPRAFVPVSACQSYDSSACQTFIANNEKARLQVQLEKKLAQFEQNYAAFN